MTDGKLTVDGRIQVAEVLLYGRVRDPSYDLKVSLARQSAFLHCILNRYSVPAYLVEVHDWKATRLEQFGMISIDFLLRSSKVRYLSS